MKTFFADLEKACKRNDQLLEWTEYGRIYKDILCILQYRSTWIHILC